VNTNQLGEGGGGVTPPTSTPSKNVLVTSEDVCGYKPLEWCPLQDDSLTHGGQASKQQNFHPKQQSISGLSVLYKQIVQEMQIYSTKTVKFCIILLNIHMKNPLCRN